MKTGTRLQKAYDHAKVECFDDRSRYVFLSDSHRGDGSLSDEFARNKSIFLYALEYYHYYGFTYVEAGDGDEIWEHGKFKHIHFAHSEVFDSLKKFHDEDRLILLYGNHNMQYKRREYVRHNLFCIYDEYEDDEYELFYGIKVHEALVLQYKPTGQEILTVHGHQGDLMNDQLWVASMFFLRYLWRFMHVVGFQNPTSPAKNATKTHKIERAFNRWILRNEKMLICGHTHKHKYPRRGELPYFNTGCCIQPTGITGIEIMDGQIMLVEWKIRAGRDGILKIARKVFGLKYLS